MRKATYFFYLVSYSLFLAGAILAYLENASELSIWFIAFGIMLDITLLILPIFGSSPLKLDLKHKGLMPWGLISLIIAILVVVISIPLRFLAYNTLFHNLLVLSVILWTISLIVFTKYIYK